MMTKIIALFGSQEETTQALDKLSGWDIETTVVESINEVEPGNLIAAAPPSVSTALPPVAFAVGPNNVFADVDMGNLKDEAISYLAERVQRGGVVVVVDTDDDLADKVKATLEQHGSQVYDAS